MPCWRAAMHRYRMQSIDNASVSSHVTPGGSIWRSVERRSINSRRYQRQVGPLGPRSAADGNLIKHGGDGSR